MIIFGYHSGTQNTQNSTYVRHLKWGRLERGHFELLGIRQQDSLDYNQSVDNALNPPFDFDISENEITMVL